MFEPEYKIYYYKPKYNIMATEIKATVFPQFTLKMQEIGKAAILAGITAALTLIGTSIYAGKLPTLDELKAAGLVGLTTAIGVIIRDFTKPTTTVIKGLDAPIVNVHPSGTVTTTEAAK